jgi:hypothetical protein
MTLQLENPRPRRAGLFRILGIVGAMVAFAGCADGPIEVPLIPVDLVDSEPAWSADGSTVAFVRSDSSAFGPPGLYAMTWPGLDVRLVRALDPTGLRGLRFSGDDTGLIAGKSGALLHFDLATGTQTTIPVNTMDAALPDETSDRSLVAYVRPSDPLGTLWQYEPAVPRDSLIRINGGVSYGSYPRFSAGDSLLAYAQLNGLYVLRRSSGVGTQITVSGSNLRHTVPRWLDDRRLLFNEVSGSGQRYYIVDRFTSVRVEVPLGIFESEAVSPGGDSIVVQGFDRTDPGVARIVLFVRGITSDAATARQITRYEP